MKLTKSDLHFEGTPEELAQAGLQPLFNGSAPTNGLANAKSNGSSNQGDDVQRFLDTQVPYEMRASVEAVLAEVTTWQGVETLLGGTARRGGPRYIRVRRRGSAAGAFLYLHPKIAILRLQGNEANGMTHATARNVDSRNPHQVRVKFDGPDSVREAIDLARRAYDQT